MLPPDDATWNQMRAGQLRNGSVQTHPVGIDSFLVDPPCGPAIVPRIAGMRARSSVAEGHESHR